MNGLSLPMDSASALIAWYAAMGVEILVGDNPHNYFAPPPQTQQPPRPSTTARIITPPTLPQEESVQACTLASQAQDVESLLKLMQDMDLCPLKRTALKGVKGWGNPHAPLLIIGDMPNEDDEKDGHYYSAEAGKLLENMLRAIGLSKESCYAMPLVWWRPPAGRQPTASEMASCAPFIARFIALQNPKALLITGGLSAGCLLNAQGSLQQLRSKSWEYKQEDTAMAIPAIISFSAYHLLRQPSLKQAAWQDWLRLSKNLASYSAYNK
jgi:uracil-DNA glycosylase